MSASGIQGVAEHKEGTFSAQNEQPGRTRFIT